MKIHKFKTRLRINLMLLRLYAWAIGEMLKVLLRSLPSTFAHGFRQGRVHNWKRRRAGKRFL
jgi:hypothetical protein